MPSDISTIFVLTVHKAQGMALPQTVLYLDNQVFSLANICKINHKFRNKYIYNR